MIRLGLFFIKKIKDKIIENNIFSIEEINLFQFSGELFIIFVFIDELLFKYFTPLLSDVKITL